MTVASEIQTKILSRSSTPQEYRVYRAGLEWDLAEPIVVDSAEDFRSAQRWRDRLTPYHHQVTNLITFCRRLPVTLLADDVGLGKTISAGLIMSELIARARIAKILIVCPKLLAPQWKEELETKFDIRAGIATGRALITADPDAIGAVITTYDSARLYLDDIPEDRFQMLILDEAHKLRNLYRVDKVPQVATRFRKALEDRRFRFVLMLTATPIQNRLWDLYSLVDLLTVARGHDNPFGDEGPFARRFITDRRGQARELRPEARDEFRSIVYGYMSRVRRGDAKLHFPDRVVQMHKVDPTAAELDLIKAIAEPIQRLNRLAQISILQALTSSPAALMAQLATMAKNGTVPPALLATMIEIVASMPASAKLNGLGSLIERLKKENPDRWRLVVFTGRLETQNAIQAFLENHGLTVGLINGHSGARNQETLERFRRNPPDCRVIVSTEAGSEGVNLQAANVLVNYDLPWNPMIVEQRIGRIQRLASDHAHVGIFNITLRGTFEDYIVGRLMEKLQLAAHAIGDVEALLQGSDIGDGDDETASFEDRILDLVLAALAGKDVNMETLLTERSIHAAKTELERQEAAINDMLGSAPEAGYAGPRTPSLPGIERSMAPREFTLAALGQLGVRLTPKSDQLYLAEENSNSEYIRFEEQPSADVKSILYVPGSAAFQRLVGRIVARGIHAVDDLDDDPARQSEDIARRWVEGFGAKAKGVEFGTVRRSFGGVALLRVRATVAHDSYERLVEVRCAHDEHCGADGQSSLSPLGPTVDAPAALGIDVARLAKAAGLDDAVAEFSRFYLERRDQEVKAAGEDERKRVKLQDEFTPRLETALVGLDGELYRMVELRVRYAFDAESGYEDALSLVPHTGEVTAAPGLGYCSKTNRMVPGTCLAKCDISGGMVLRHLLVTSDVSGRLALPEFSGLCSLSGQRALTDELETSAVTGKPVVSTLLKTSSLSGKRAEPEHFGQCAFTQGEVLLSELAVSEISGKPYRIDQQMRSAVSGRAGHSQEFVVCHLTRQPVVISEAEKCAVTGYSVRPGVLESCAVTGERVLPTELEACTVTGQRVLKRLLVTSSLSGLRMRRDVAVRSSDGRFCAPAEARACLWSARKHHPDDLRTCKLTGLEVHFEFATTGGPPRLLPLVEMLDGIRRSEDETQLWDGAAKRIASALKRSRCRIRAAVLSPARQHLAVCAEFRTLLGLRAHQVGAVYDIAEDAVAGRLAVGRRGSRGWTERGQ